jgi:hypothetical protein
VEAKIETKLHTTHRNFALQIRFSLNNDSKLTRASLLGKWPTEEKYKLQKPCNSIPEETLC